MMTGSGPNSLIDVILPWIRTNKLVRIRNRKGNGLRCTVWKVNVVLQPAGYMCAWNHGMAY